MRKRAVVSVLLSYIKLANNSSCVILPFGPFDQSVYCECQPLVGKKLPQNASLGDTHMRGRKASIWHPPYDGGY